MLRIVDRSLWSSAFLPCWLCYAGHVDDTVAQLDPDDMPRYCPFCLYNLRGLGAAESCPECGESLEIDGESRSSIPWNSRVGPIPLMAFMRTCTFVTFRQKQFCAELARPCDLRSAVQFRLCLSLLVSIAAVLPITFYYLLESEQDSGWATWVDELYDSHPWWWWGGLIYGLLAAILSAIAATGLHTYWFHPRALPEILRDRGLALSQYACAPLAWLIVPSVLFSALLLLGKLLEEDGKLHEFQPIITPSLFVILALAVLVLALTASNLVRLAVRLAHRGWPVIGMLLATCLFGVVGIAALLFVALPLAILFVVVVFMTL